ncbi:MAG: hypothetical protein FWG31_01695 [Oscillospiraceae bacterium]|nr:hypothetical protein [Oscillospiraceae bacterium]
MIQKKSVIGAAAFFIVMALTVGFFSIGADIGGKEDPLVSLSYLEAMFPEINANIESAVEEKINAQMQDIAERIQQQYDKIASMPGGSSPVNVDELIHNEAFIADIVARIMAQTTSSGEAEWPFARLEVGKDKTLHIPQGTQVMLRLGIGTVSATSSPGLIDMTDAGTLDNGGTLAPNHLYTVTMAAGRDIKCTTDITVFVWGPYIIR